MSPVILVPWASHVVLVVKNSPAKAGDIRDAGSNPGSGRPPRGGHDNPLQYSFLENPMDTGAWQAMVHRVTKSQTRLKQLSTHTYWYLSLNNFNILSLNFKFITQEFFFF